MIVEFDYTRLGKNVNEQPPLIVAVNGAEVLFEHGIDLTNGKFGSLGICRDGRYVYQIYPEYIEGFLGSDEFLISFDDGTEYLMEIQSKNGRTQTTLYLRNLDSGKWDRCPCPDLEFSGTPSR